MEKVSVQVEVPKQMNDVSVAVVSLLQGIKAKKDMATLAAENLPKIYAAVDGLSLISEESKDASAIDCGALLAANIAKVLMGKA